MKRKVLAAVLAATMVIGSVSLTGCGSDKKKKVEAPTVKELYKANAKLVEDIKDGEVSVKATVKASIDAKASGLSEMVDGDNDTLKASITAMGEVSKEAAHYSLKYDINAFGEKENSELEGYVTADGDTYMTVDGGDWVKTSGSGFDFDDLDLDEDDDAVKDTIKKIQKELDKDDKNAKLELKDDEWVLTIKSDVKEAMESEAMEELEDLGDLDSMIGSLGLDTDDLEDLEGTVTTTIKFDEKTEYVTYIGVEFSDEFLESISDVLSDYIDSIDELEFSLKIEYNDDEVEVPSKVKDNALDATGGSSNGGGSSVIIDDGGNSGIIDSGNSGSIVTADGTLYTVELEGETAEVLFDEEWTDYGDGFFFCYVDDTMLSVFISNSYQEANDTEEDILKDIGFYFDDATAATQCVGEVNGHKYYAMWETGKCYIYADAGCDDLVEFSVYFTDGEFNQEFVEILVGYIQ